MLSFVIDLQEHRPAFKKRVEMTATQPSENFGPVLKVSDLGPSQGEDIEIVLDPEQATVLAQRLEISAARKVRLTGRLAPLGAHDWQFIGQIGATVVQPCVISLDPVTTRIEAPVERTWIRGLEPISAEESETPEDVSIEPLGPEIDMGAVLAEAVALNLPDYPRADGVALEETVFTEPGKEALTDAETKPFAGLAALRDQLRDDSGGGSDSDG